MSHGWKIFIVFLIINMIIGAITLAREEATKKNLVGAWNNLFRLNWEKFKDGSTTILGIIFLTMLGIITFLLFRLSSNRMSNTPH